MFDLTQMARYDRAVTTFLFRDTITWRAIFLVDTKPLNVID